MILNDKYFATAIEIIVTPEACCLWHALLSPVWAIICDARNVCICFVAFTH